MANICADHLVYDQVTQLNAEAKNKASNRHIFRVLARLYSLILYIICVSTLDF